MKAKWFPALLGFLLSGAACGGSTATWQLTIVTPHNNDLFKMGVSQVRLTFNNQIQTAAVSNDSFTLSLTMDVPSTDQNIQVVLEALDGNGTVVARGKSPSVVLSATASNDSTALTLYVSPLSAVSQTPVQLYGEDSATIAGRGEVSAVALRGQTTSPPAASLGVLITGGVNGSGVVFQHSWLYDPLTVTLLDAGAPAVARRGAVLISSADANTGQQALLWGGADSTGKVVATAELFDPTTATLSAVFSPPDSDVATAPAGVGSASAEISAGVFLASGGLSAVAGSSPTPTPVPQAALLERYPPATGSSGTAARLGIKPTAMNMVSARSHHTVTPMAALDGSPGALIYGGTAGGDPNLAEIFSSSKGTFAALALTPPQTGAPAEWRQDHVAFPLSDGRVLIAGGVDVNGNPLRSALLIAANGGVERRDTFLQTARTQAAVASFGSEILICGGIGVDMTTMKPTLPLNTCEIFTPAVITSNGPGRVAFMPTARASFVMAPLETGNLLFIGGTNSNGPVAQIDAYTAP